MNSFVDDPRLTAYALGEVDEAERAEVESLLKRSPDARRWVESVQQTSARLSAALKEELLVSNYELRITNDELQSDRGAIEVGDFEADSVHGQSRTIRAASASAGLEQATDSQTNRSLALPALKGRRVLRLIPFALAASVAVASGVTYVAWKQNHDEKVASLKCITCLHQIGHGLGQYRYDYSPAVPTVVLADSTVSNQGDATSNMRTGLVQVTPAVDMQEVGSAVRTDLANLASNVDLDGSAADASVSIDTDADGQSDSSTTPAFASVVAMPQRSAKASRNPNDPQPWYEQVRYPSDSPTESQIVLGIAPRRFTDTIEKIRQREAEAAGMANVEGAVETMDYDPSHTGAVSPGDFALAVDSLTGNKDRLSETRFTSSGYDYVDHQAQSAGARADSPPQIGLKAKPNMDLHDTQNNTYRARRASVGAVPAPGNGQSIFGGSGGGEEEFPEHATYDIKVPKGQYSSISARDQAHMLRSVADVEDNGDPYYFAGGMQPLANSENRDNEYLNADLNYTAGTSVTATTTNVENIEFRDLGTAPTDVLARFGSVTTVNGDVVGHDVVNINGGQFRIDDKFADDVLPFNPSNAQASVAPGSFAGNIVVTGGATHVIPQSNPELISMRGVKLDFEGADNISFGYQVPFGPPGAQPLAGNSAHEYLRSWDGFPIGYDIDPRTAESYDPVIEIPFLFVENQPLSTFSIDVDTASYTNVRRMLNQNVLPPHGAVRVEEMINYFDYDYPPPTGADPFSVNVAVAECPWNPEHRLARIGIKGKVFTDRNRPAVNLVFLVDVSGSMQDANKLPLVRHGLRAMVEQLTPRDSVAIVTYADGSNVALPATSARNKQTILDAVNRLMSGGGTNGGAGIETAYQLANEHYVEGGANRVILATDGDFNVGVTRQDELVSMIEEKAATGVFLSVLGFGMGNIKDSMLEKLADKGNGLYAYIDDDVEAERVLVDQMGGTLVTIAKDVKIQVEFNPAEVGAYRLIGYENRMLRAQDFNNDAKDAGEIGAGHTVTALYEIVPAGMQAHEPGVDPLKYQGGEARAASRDEVPGDDTDMAEVDEVEEGAEVVDADKTETANGGSADPPYVGELMTVKLRYKDPEGDVSKLIELPVTDEGLTIDDASDDFVFAASVASFGMMLRGSAHTPGLSFDSVLEMAKSSMGEDPFGYREEFIQLVEKAKALSSPGQQ